MDASNRRESSHNGDALYSSTPAVAATLAKSGGASSTSTGTPTTRKTDGCHGNGKDVSSSKVVRSSKDVSSHIISSCQDILNSSQCLILDSKKYVVSHFQTVTFVSSTVKCMHLSGPVNTNRQIGISAN